MSIRIRLAEILLERRLSLTDLSDSIGVTLSNLSNLKRGSVKAIRFSTLDAICHRLECQPGEILEYQHE